MQIKIELGLDQVGEALSLVPIVEQKYDNHYKKYYSTFAIVKDVQVFYIPFFLYGTILEFCQKNSDKTQAEVFYKKIIDHYNSLPKRYKSSYDNVIAIMEEMYDSI